MAANTRYIAWLAGALLLVGSACATADQWRFPPKLVQDRFVFGRIEVIRSLDGRVDEFYPPTSIEVLRDGKSVALFRGAWFDDLFSDPAHTRFVGLSNRGVPDTAIIEFDQHGNLLSFDRHGALVPAYCFESVSLFRRWYDDAQPAVAFDRPGSPASRARQIHVRLCDGTMSTLDAVRAGSAGQRQQRDAARRASDDADRALYCPRTGRGDGRPDPLCDPEAPAIPPEPAVRAEAVRDGASEAGNSSSAVELAR